MTILLDPTRTRDPRPAPVLNLVPDPKPKPTPIPEKTTRSFRELVEKLNSFDTADDIAGYLHSQGATGNRGHAASCVIARWLTDNLPGRSKLVGVTAISAHARYRTRIPFLGVRRYEAQWKSPAVGEFVGNFDRGNYPELVA